MFGAVTAYLFEFVLGIRQRKGTAGYSAVIIEPLATGKIPHASGSIETPNGRISVEYERLCNVLKCRVEVPGNTSASFKHKDTEIPLCAGENSFDISIK